MSEKNSIYRFLGIFIVSFIANNFNTASMSDMHKDYSKVDEMALMKFLKHHILAENALFFDSL